MSERRVPAAKAIKKAEISLLLTNDREIQKLNKIWRKKDKPTDVLSFPSMTEAELIDFGRKYGKEGSAVSSGGEYWPIGDIVISLDTALRQASERGITLEQEIERLYIHGLVHLLGYDHERNTREARRMQRVERYLLTRY